MVKLSIWDMAGQDRFEIVRGGFYRGSRAAALVYDVTSIASLGNLKRWRDEVLRVRPGQPFVVVGNKVDSGTHSQLGAWPAGGGLPGGALYRNQRPDRRGGG